jgi:hypothetical protein
VPLLPVWVADTPTAVLSVWQLLHLPRSGEAVAGAANAAAKAKANSAGMPIVIRFFMFRAPPGVEW